MISRKKITFLSYLIGPILLAGCFLLDKNGLFILSILLLIIYVLASSLFIFFTDIDDMRVDSKIPSHLIRFFLKKVKHSESHFYIYKDNPYKSITLLEWDGFFLRKIKGYSNFESFLFCAKNDIDKYIKENKSVNTYYGFDGFLTNEERIAYNRDKKLKKLIK